MKAVNTAFAVFIFSLLGSTLADLAGECNMVAFYQELGCTPKPGQSNTTCPEAFICPSLHPDPTMCFYKGVPYSHGSYIPYSEIDHPCSISCICHVGYHGAEFQCAAVDCFDSFRHRNTEDCIYTHRLNSCCAGVLCDKDEIAKLKTCEYDGKIYKEGESIYPKNTHKSCVCTDQWDGSIDNPNSCRDIRCGIEIHSQNRIQQYCAPLFYQNSRSCPITFICPSPTSKVLVNDKNLDERRDSSKCLFGYMVLSVGDEISVDKSCTKCRCDVPPFVTCTFTNSC